MKSSESPFKINSVPQQGPRLPPEAAELVRNKQRAALFANPLGKACFELDKAPG